MARCPRSGERTRIFVVEASRRYCHVNDAYGKLSRPTRRQGYPAVFYVFCVHQAIEIFTDISCRELFPHHLSRDAVSTEGRFFDRAERVSSGPSRVDSNRRALVCREVPLELGSGNRWFQSRHRRGVCDRAKARLSPHCCCWHEGGVGSRPVAVSRETPIAPCPTPRPAARCGAGFWIGAGGKRGAAASATTIGGLLLKKLGNNLSALNYD